jgi:F0F1-type ATP synthase membrane subunit b/b'
VLQARSRLIQRTIEEAEQFAHEARNRLTEIESRWAHLDSKIASIQAVANAELENEKRTLQAKTAEGARRILEYSRQEIGVAEQRAPHELKVFAADLAVSIARQSIRIDEKTDQGLIRSFVAELGHGGEIAQATLEG